MSTYSQGAAMNAAINLQRETGLPACVWCDYSVVNAWGQSPYCARLRADGPPSARHILVWPSEMTLEEHAEARRA